LIKKTMRKLISITLILLHLILITPVEEVFAAEYRLKASSFSPGKKTESANYKLKQSAVGEPFGGKSSNNNYTVDIGYIPSSALNYPRLNSNIPDGFASGSLDLDDYFEDLNGGILTYSVTGNTSINVTIDPTTHIITWSPMDGFTGSEEIIFIAETIESAQTSSNSVILTVKAAGEVNNPPKLHYIEDITAYEGQVISLDASAYDVDGDVLTYTYMYPFDENGQWQPDYEDSGTYNVEVRVSDGRGGSDSQTIDVIVQNTNRAPVIESVNTITVIDGDVSLSQKDEGSLIRLEPYAYDPDGGEVTITYSAPFAVDGSWSVPYNFTGTDPTALMTTTITASNDAVSSSVNVNISIKNINITPSVDLSLSSYSVSVDTDFTINVNVSDADGDNLKLTLKKIKGETEEIIENQVDITSIYTEEYSINEQGSYVIEAIVNDVTTVDPKETIASVDLEITPISQNENAIKPIVGDFNGDGMSDVGYLDTSNGSWHVSISDNGNFSGSTEWLTGFCNDPNIAPLSGDFNGDGLADIGYFDASGLFRIRFSNGTSFGDTTITADPGQDSARSGTFTTSTDIIRQRCYHMIGDYNGDGLTDIGYYNCYRDWWDSTFGQWRDGGGGEEFVAYSTGNGFTEFVDLLGPQERGRIPITADFNGDGFGDFCSKDDGNWKLTLSKGDGLVSGPPIEVSDFGNGKDPAIGDFNQDGLIDIGYFDKTEEKIYYRAFKGDSFDNTTRLYLGSLGATSSDTPITIIGDYNGDAILDAGVFDKTKFGINKWTITLHNSKLPDLLVEINNGMGGTTAIEYERSTQLDNTGADGNPTTNDLPFPVRVVKKVTKTNGLGNSYATTYYYRDGYFETDTREFRGFGYVRVMDPEGHYKITEFHQDNTYKGRPNIEVVYDKYNRKYQEISYSWQSSQVRSPEGGEAIPGVIFPYLHAKTTTVYNPQDESDLKSTRVEYTYDDYGSNVLEIKEYGFNNTVLKKTTVDYADPNIASWIIGKPSISIIYEGDGTTKVAETRYYYDNQALGVAPTHGALTKEERWLDLPVERYISTYYGYDTYGNIRQVTDALGRITTTTYDETTKTFPASVENAIGHTQQFTYKYETGKILTSTDPNGKTTTSTYDGFGRLARVEGPGALSYVEYEYASKEARPQWVKTTTKVGGGLPDQVSYNYADGLGRTIETTVVVDGGRQIASSIVEYDSRGQIIKKYLPYYEAEGAAPAWGAPVQPPVEVPFTQYFYDPMGRTIKTIRPDGKVSQNIYTATTTETINEKGQRNKITKDEYGKIIIVEEANGNQMHYQHDILGNLTEVTDCQGNEFIMRYDSLGRKIGMDDPDMGPNWEYIYDDVGNLISQTDAKGQAIEFQYDDINRLIYKSTGVSYIYNDNLKAGDPYLPNGIGRLDRVTYPGGEASFEYDTLGREVVSRKVIDGHEYIVTRDYDALDRLTEVTYPDGTTATYKYNRQGGVDLVGEGTDEDYFVKETRYDQYGHLEYVRYANGSITEYTYDEYTLKLTHLTTKDASGTIIQDLDYDFDAVGNIKSVIDSVHESNTQYFTYDVLNRLKSAATSGTNGYGSIDYSYDDIGNITQKGGATLLYEETGNAGPHAVTSLRGAASGSDEAISYDLNGNMETKGSTSYAYDIENRVTEVAIPRGGEVSSITINFTAGWNFFSTPYRTINNDGPLTPIENVPIDALLSDINYEQISKYDTSLGEWSHFVNNSKFDQFSNFEYGEGYLIYCSEAGSLTLTGSTPASTQQKALNTGWNLVFGPSDTSIAVPEALEGIAYDSVKAYNGAVYEEADTFEAGKAYWVHTSGSQTWNIQPPLKTTTYSYDGDGSRTKRITNNKINKYIGSAYEIEVVDDDIKTIKQIYLGNQRLCSVELIYEDGAATPTDTNTYFNHSDHLGSSNVITNQTGDEVQNYQYKPYGELASYNETGYNTDRRFAGKTYDESTGSLINFGARLYDYELGRFISPDPTVQKPYDPQTYNRYAYARNNPIRWVDLDGYGFWSWIKSFFRGFVGAVIGAVLTLANVPAPIAFAIGGAVSGAIFGGMEGGLSGALQGAAWGAATGFAFGTLNAIDPSGTLVALAAIGGAVYAGVSGGMEGLANYAAGALGAFAGYATVDSIHSSLISKPTVNTQQSDTNTGNNQQNSGVKSEVQDNLNDGDLTGTGDTRSPDLTSPAQDLADRGGDIAQGGQNGTAGSGGNNLKTPPLVYEPGPLPSTSELFWRGFAEDLQVYGRSAYTVGNKGYTVSKSFSSLGVAAPILKKIGTVVGGAGRIDMAVGNFMEFVGIWMESQFPDPYW